MDVDFRNVKDGMVIENRLTRGWEAIDGDLVSHQCVGLAMQRLYSNGSAKRFHSP
jgi:hypothetical protein